MLKHYFHIIGFVLIILFSGSCAGLQKKKSSEPNRAYGVVIHGGAGYIKNLPPEWEKSYKKSLNEALEIAYQILEEGGTAVEAVETAIRYMENDTLFNAGRGAVLNHLGKPELDASIMNGRTLNAGAVAGVSHIKNPISAARLVMDSSKHVFLIGRGAEEFARIYGLDMVDESYFILPRRIEQLKRIRNKQAYHSHTVELNKYGTVGCVALDKYGNLAAGTSTGGLMNKQFGRVGDSPIIGAGTYADNNTCAVSATGTGEFFIRTVAAYTVSALMHLNELSLDEALQITIEKIEKLGGDGGLIGIDKSGNPAWYFNTEGMFRAYKTSNGKKEIQMYGMKN